MHSCKQVNRWTMPPWVWLLVGLALTAGVLAACGKSSEADALSLEISSNGNNLAFDKPTLTAPAGQAVELTFHNKSNTFQHNWMLVAGDKAVADQVNQAATTAGPELKFIPADTSQILAHTKLLSRGDSDTITFTAPTTSGEYVYFCSFPGHYLAGMKGVLVVKP